MMETRIGRMDTSAKRASPRGASALIDYYRCPVDEVPAFTVPDSPSTLGYFAFREATCYGRFHQGRVAHSPQPSVPDLSSRVEHVERSIQLPFDLAEIVDNIRLERYRESDGSPTHGIAESRALERAYYLIRPLLSVGVRRHLQRFRLSGWENISFPRWPVDFTVEVLMESALALALETSGRPAIPFVWFWPEGAPSCAIVTHDVEERAGRDACPALMDLDERYGFKASFQLIPESRYETSDALLNCIRDRGFEANVHDLNHDGRLFRSKEHFLSCAHRINEHVRRFQSLGFRSGAMYRRQEWLEALAISYDMSVPNVAHLEPQRGGCATVMPYFNGDIVELPLTTVQDYSLFHILGDYSTRLWKTQIDAIIARHGLITVISHPDYLLETRASRVYEELLAHLQSLREARNVWCALPRDVNTWWRNRNAMTVVPDGAGWRIEGPDSHRARVALASIRDGRVSYDLAD